MSSNGYLLIVQQQNKTPTVCEPSPAPLLPPEPVDLKDSSLIPFTLYDSTEIARSVALIELVGLLFRLLFRLLVGLVSTIF